MVKISEKERINKMTEAMIKVASGEYSIEFELSGENNEYDSLAIGLNLMVDDIRTREEELGKAYHELQNAQEASLNIMEDLERQREELRALNQQLQKEVTERKRAEEKIKLNATHLQDLVALHKTEGKSEKEILDYMIEASVRSLQSQFSFIGLISADESVMTIHSWSKNVMKKCAIDEKPIYFPVAQAGLWGEVVRQRRPIVVDNYDTTTEYKKGYPEGHVTINSFLGVPIFADNKIVAVGAVANKESPYDQADIDAMASLLHEMWNLIQRKRSEDALRESEERYRAIFEQSTDSIALIDIDTANFVAFNTNAHKNLGYTRKEFAKLHTYDIDATEVADDAKKHKDEMMNKGMTSFETKHSTKNGEVRDVQVSISLINIGDKNSILGVWQDITERKKAEEALRESEERYHAIFEQASDSIVLIDMGTREMFDFNDRAYQNLGYTRQEFAKLRLDDIDILKSPDYARIHDEKMEKDGSDIFETEHRAKNGNIRNVLVSARSLNISGKNFSLSIWHDITELKRSEEALRESEEKYRAIFEQALSSIMLIDTDDGKILDFNDTAYQNLGYTRQEFAKIKIMDIDINLLEENATTDRKKTWIEKRMEVFEAKHRTKNGELRDVLVFSKLVRLRRKNLALAVSYDITERKRTENNLKQAMSDLEKSSTQLANTNRELEAFSYSVSHDLRAPLRTIDGFSQALLEDYLDTLDEQGQDYLQRVRAASQRMGKLIDDMLKLSRLSRSEMNNESIDLSALAEEVTTNLRQMEPERKVEVSISSGLNADGDRQLLRIAMENLLGNAWKFTSKHPKARIEVGTMPNGDKKAFFVRDNGAGFDMSYADKLFGAFQRLHDTAEFPGTGIGLATVQRIVHRHGGNIWAEGDVGKGATFYFTLN